MIKQYTKKDGSKAYMFVAYLGIDPITGKQKRTTRRGFKTKREASIAEAKLITEVEKEGFKAETNMTFKDLYDIWIENYRLTVKPSTFHAQNTIIKNHILPYFQNIRITRINIIMCQKFVNEISEKFVRYHNIKNLVYRILEHAIHLKIINNNPMANVLRPKKKEGAKPRDFWSINDVQKFNKIIKSYDLNLQALYRLLLYTGARKSEILALRWTDIDFNNSSISIYRTLAFSENGHIFQTPKTKSSKRTISIDAETKKILRKHYISQQETILKYNLERYGDEQLVVTNSDNRFCNLDFPNHYFDQIIDNNDLKRITIHGLRHTHASLLFEAGATIKEVQERLGHNDIKTTMNIYTHVTEKTKEETADKFAKYIG